MVSMVTGMYRRTHSIVIPVCNVQSIGIFIGINLYIYILKDKKFQHFTWMVHRVLISHELYCF
jgi:hypothetical protein